MAKFSSPGKMLYRGPGMESFLQGPETLAQTLLASRQLETQQERALAMAAKDERKEQQRLRDGAASLLDIKTEGIPDEFINMYFDYVDNEVLQVQNNDADLFDSKRFLTSLRDQLISMKGADYEDVRDSRYDLTQNNKDRERFANDGNFYETILSINDLSAQFEDDEWYSTYGYFAGPPPQSFEDRKAFKANYMNRDNYAWTDYVTVTKDERGGAVINLRNNYSRGYGDQDLQQNIGLSQIHDHGGFDRVYDEQYYRTFKPSQPPAFFAKDIRSWVNSTTQGQEVVNRNSQEARNYISNTLLLDPGEDGQEARYTLYEHLMKLPEDKRKLTEQDLSAFAQLQPELLGGDSEATLQRYQSIFNDPETQNFFIDAAETQQKPVGPTKEETQIQESTEEIGGSFIQKVDAAPMDIVNAATGEMILSEYSGDIKTYNVGRLRTGEVNRIVIPNPEYDPSKAGRLGYSVPENLEVNVEQIRVYNVGGKDVIGLVSLDSNLNRQPELYIEVGNVANSDIENALRTNIKNAYGLTLDNFLDGSLDMESPSSPKMLTFTEWQVQNKGGTWLQYTDYVKEYKANN